MDSSVIKKTQDTIGKVIKKPPLTDKLLSKPPFRFLHDIITEVIKNTGLLKGLFKPEELNSENVKDRDAKISFLQKAIDCVAMVTGENLTVRPSKIVAGHEPEKTNEFLQALGKACMKKMDSSESVKKVLAGEKPSSGKSRKKEGSGTRSSSKERPKESTEKRKEPEKKEEKESRRKDDRKGKESTSAKRSKDERERNSAKEKDKEKEREKSKERQQEKESDVTEAENEPKIDSIADEITKDIKLEDDSVSNRTIQRPSSAKGQRRRPTNQEGDKENRSPSDEAVETRVESTVEEPEKEEPTNLVDESSLRQQSALRRVARPSSARPAPPKVKRNTDVEDEGARLGSGKQFNAVIVDNGKDDEDDDDLFVVEENTNNEPYFEQTSNDNTADVEDGQHGSLVKKMLDSKREAEIIQARSVQNKEKPVIIDATRKKEKELAQREIDKLRNSIQVLCRSVHPLGKVMDYLQEDMDSMQKELAMWRKENQQHRLALKAELSITESDLEPLHAQLGELELEITDMVDKISSVKSNIIRNDEKIKELISGISR